MRVKSESVVVRCAWASVAARPGHRCKKSLDSCAQPNAEQRIFVIPTTEYRWYVELGEHDKNLASKGGVPASKRPEGLKYLDVEVMRFRGHKSDKPTLS